MAYNWERIIITVIFCLEFCGNAVSYMPSFSLCAGDRVTPPMTFRNLQQLRYYNHLSKKNLKPIYSGPCDSCQSRCKVRVDPVCAIDQETKDLRVFSCPCEMSTYDCQYHTNYCEVDYTECDVVHDPCEEYQPVCAGQGITAPITFNSTCLLDEYNAKYKTNLTVIYNGTCDVCNCTTSSKYSPVCAYEGCSTPITFNNTKALQLYNCQYRRDLRVLHFGECEVYDPPSQTCPLVNDPICAGDGVNATMAFPNNCSLQVYNKEKQTNLQIIYNGTCDPCNCSCTEEYNPVCAVEGCNSPMTFSNPCSLQLHNCQYRKSLKVLFFGECGIPCNCTTFACPHAYEPVCAGDGVNSPQTFDNLCQLDKYNTKMEPDLTILYSGTCDKCDYLNCSSIANSPICAINLEGTIKMTFNNTCFMNVYNCQYREDMKPYYNGPCVKC